MSGFSAINYALSKKLDNAILTGVVSHRVDNVNKTITFTFKDGTSSTLQFNNPSNGKDGVGIATMYKDSNNHLIVTLSDGSTIDVGELPIGDDSGVVKKTDITTSIDSTSTNDEVPSAKAVYNTTTNFLKTYTSLEQIGLTSGSETIENIATNMKSKSRLIAIIEGGNKSVYPNTSGTLIVEKMNIYRTHFKFCVDGSPTVFVGTYHAVSRFTGWQRLCTTTVADVPFKSLTVNNWASGRVVYTVKNGICYIWVSPLESPTMDINSQIVVSNLPIPKSPGLWHSIGSNDCTKGTLLLLINDKGEMQNYSGLKNVQYFGSFSYPVAE